MKKIVLLLLIAVQASAQNKDALFQRGVLLQKENKFVEALAMFQQMVKIDSNNVDYLTHTSYLLCKVGNRQATDASKQNYFHKAEYLSKKAVGIDAKSAEAHYNYALALARINENASSKQKIANAKLIKTECDEAIKLNPNQAGAYHILGRWHRTIAGFNGLEKMMINTLFGGVPEGGAYESAIDCFNKAVALEPDYMLHKYELAVTYYERDSTNDKAQAELWCGRVIEMDARSDDDYDTKEKARALLKKVK